MQLPLLRDRPPPAPHLVVQGLQYVQADAKLVVQLPLLRDRSRCDQQHLLDGVKRAQAVNRLEEDVVDVLCVRGGERGMDSRLRR